MRLMMIGALALLSTTTLAAQDRTLISEGASHGGFGGPTVRLTKFAGKSAIAMGGRGGFIVNGTYVFGGGGAGWSSPNVIGNDDVAYQLDVGYGGVEFEYIHRTTELIHVAAQIGLGAGGVTRRPAAGGAGIDDSFFFAEPGVQVEMNVTKGFRVGAGVSYRHVTGVDLPAFSDADMSGASATLTFKFGSFH